MIVDLISGWIQRARLGRLKTTRYAARDRSDGRRLEWLERREVLSASSVSIEPPTQLESVQQDSQRADEARELVFVDTQGLRSGPLRDRIHHDPDWYELSPLADGVQQIGAVLSASKDLSVSVSSVHIVSHAAAGRVTIGASDIRLGTLSKFAASLEEWSAWLSPGADIRWYGCNLGSGPDGPALLSELSQLTGADIAASTNPTSSDAERGDWQLELELGAIESTATTRAIVSTLSRDVQDTLALPSGFRDELVVSGLNQPIAIASLPDDQMLILQRGGTILITDPLSDQPTTTTYLQLPDVDAEGERGLLAIALDPDFAENQFFYLYYHNALAERARIARFVHESSRGDLESEFVIWEDSVTTRTDAALDHWGGGLSFGPNGYLYLTIGDKKENPADAQDLSLAAGKIIRLDVSAADAGGEWQVDGANLHLIPDDNPFVDGAGNNLDEIWALGLRNPFRVHWDLATERFLIGEVGGNVQAGPDISFEDIHIATPDSGGANFGWPMCEGPKCTGAEPPNYSPPIFSIRHLDSRAIVPGFVYHGEQFPDQYENVLFVADFTKGWLRYLRFDASGELSDDVPVGGFRFSDDGDLGHPVMLAMGPEGAIYYLDLVFRTDRRNGSLRRIVFEQTNRAPIIDAVTTDITVGASPLSVNFAAVAHDPDAVVGAADRLTFTWHMGDGTTLSGSAVAHTYLEIGSYIATLVVSDGMDRTRSEPIEISVGSPPVASIVSPLDRTRFRAGDVIHATGMGTDTDGELRDEDFSWTVQFLHDDHRHPVIFDVKGRALDFAIPTEGHDFSGTTGFEISLVVTDRDGLRDVDTVTVFPDKVALAINTNVPAPIRLTLDGLARTAPFVHDSLVGFKHTVTLPQTVLADGLVYEFVQWSNGDTSFDRVLTVPETDSTVTAVYRNTGRTPRVSAGLLTLYTFDIGGGDTVFDVSGSETPLDLSISDVANVTWASGTLQIDQSVVISSTRPAAAVTQAVRDSNEITVEAWLQTASTEQSGPARIVSVSDSTTARNVTMGQGDSSAEGGLIDVRLRTTTTGINAANPSLSTPVDSLTPDMSHVVFTRNSNGQAKTYIDNVLVASDVIPGEFTNWSDSYALVLANEATGDRPWLGTFDLVAIYDRALSSEEVTINFQARTVAALNHEPIAQPDAWVADAGAATVIPVDELLRNDDLGNLPTAITQVDAISMNGGAIQWLNGTIAYSPPRGFTGRDSFGYTITDADGDSDSGVVSVHVMPTLIPGDANRDGRFNSTDLVRVFAAGEYLDEIAGNSIWEDGDWNGDGEFDTSDLVFALSFGAYEST